MDWLAFFNYVLPGQVTDVYIPTPFRHFAFVQFSESKVAQSLLGKEHDIKVVLVELVVVWVREILFL